MKIILTTIFLIITFFGLTQKTEYLYSIKFLKCCGEPTHYDPTWELVGLNGQIYIPINNKLLVPINGQYELVCSYFDDQPIPIQIDNTNQTDTIYLKCLDIEYSDLVEAKNHKETDPIYITCMGKIESTYREFFPNGKLKLIGNFHHGILIDSLVEYYYSGYIKSKVLKNKTTYEHWYYYPSGKLKKRYRYDLKKRNRYQLFEYDELGKIITEIDYSKKYSFRYYDTGTIKTTTPERKYEQHFIVNDTLIYLCKNGIETTFYSNGNKRLVFSCKPLSWWNRFRSSKKTTRKEYKLQYFEEDSADIKIQEIRFWLEDEISIYNGKLSKLDVADAFSISFYKNNKLWITIYPIVYEKENIKEIVLYELYDFSKEQVLYQKLKPNEMEDYLNDRKLKIKCW
ncbi:MAG: hypothetical protein M9916_06955 [Crocinitomicaceae bacterium]|jgi:antitoxin component YwqK of YwqJK toxin-antitoxin module|nr:hypothetical protein [Crocinitomicaceae bacterium]